MGHQKWNWQTKEWPHFTFKKEAIEALERNFLQKNGVALGAFKHIKQEEKDQLLIQILSDEALKTSEIEGEFLNIASIQESIKKNLGLESTKRKLPPAEFGVSEMMVDLYKTYNQPLSHKQMFQWHNMLTSGRRDLVDTGRYRTHEDPMQIVSGRLDRPTVHFEAPPSKVIRSEMDEFVIWFNTVHTIDNKSISPLAKAGIAHFYFVTIHPFEDGNGRIGRAIAEKSISQSIQRPALISLSQMIEAKKKEYYGTLEKHNRKCELTDWLVYFGQTILDAQENTLKVIDFLIQKAHYFDRFSNQMNKRQLKVIRRVFEEGHTGFKGGLSADNYTRIAGTSASTATRDLKHLIDIGALYKTGALKGTRYYLQLSEN
ncbi:Fic family protein [Zobellia alginiliquefaciens]|uniref:Fic family protein n=1 Tax=Zobellia alginiliquefaciens TaxID=3032586 RepID=UPI0023E15185|nr:Fic family protein [Zobellia alginiliquefaciens]